MTREILTRHGYNVLDAANGAEATSILLNYEHDVHLMLTDAIMPGMSGPALAERLVADRPQLRVLYTSGYTDDTIVYRIIQGCERHSSRSHSHRMSCCRRFTTSSMDDRAGT